MGTDKRKKLFTEMLTDSLYGALWRYACRLSPCRADAEDLCQETLIRAFERIEQQRSDGNAKAWFFKIMYSVFINKYRRESMRQTLTLIEGTVASPRRHEPDVPVEEVRCAVRNLPDLQREVVELFYFDELSLEEVADIIGVNINTVKQRLFRARDSLRQKLMADKPGNAIVIG